MSPKLFFCGALLISFLGAGCGRPAPATPPTPPTELSPSMFQERTIGEETSTYTIDVRYPYLVGWNKETEDAFNAVSEERALELVANFKKDVSGVETDAEFFQRPWFLGQKSEVQFVSSTFVTIVGDGSVDSGGAHPNALYDAWMFDVASRREIALADLFRVGAPYLEKLSELSLAELRRRNEIQEFTDEGLLIGGTAPTPENYALAYLTPDGIAVTFAPYQVAAYAAGPQEVTLPLEAFDGLWAEGMCPVDRR